MRENEQIDTYFENNVEVHCYKETEFCFQRSKNCLKLSDFFLSLMLFHKYQPLYIRVSIEFHRNTRLQKLYSLSNDFNIKSSVK